MNKNQWLSAYIFSNIPFEKVIKELIKPLLEDFNSSKSTQSSFFIRYWEQGPHIRLRILPKSKGNRKEIRSKIKKKSVRYFADSKVLPSDYTIEFHKYIPEIERYGGEKMMKIAEKHFEQSSKTIVYLIDKQYHKWDYSLSISYAIQLHLVLAKNIFPDLRESSQFFNILFKNWLYYSIKLDDNRNVTDEAVKNTINYFEQSYEDQKEKIHHLIHTIFKERIKPQPGWIKDWSKSCSELNNAIKESIDSTADTDAGLIDEHPALSKNNLWKIFGNYIHMSNNRLGIYLRDEAFIAFLIFKGLNDNPN